jgi:hypothetical protein
VSNYVITAVRHCLDVRGYGGTDRLSRNYQARVASLNRGRLVALQKIFNPLVFSQLPNKADYRSVAVEPQFTARPFRGHGRRIAG